MTFLTETVLVCALEVEDVAGVLFVVVVMMALALFESCLFVSNEDDVQLALIGNELIKRLDS